MLTVLTWTAALMHTAAMHKTNICPHPINNGIKMHVSPHGMVAAAANSAEACCLLCSESPTCNTWCYGWPPPLACHMSSGPALNTTPTRDFASGTSAAPKPKPSAGTRPHVVVFIADDLGFANVQYSRASHGATAAEVRTPNIDGLVAEGIELMRNYVYKVCSPTRSSFQSGRLPVHVNTANLSPTITNPQDTVSGFAGIPTNMTCIANKLRQAGYKTHEIGKVCRVIGTLYPPSAHAQTKNHHGLIYFVHTLSDGLDCSGTSAWRLRDTLRPAEAMTPASVTSSTITIIGPRRTGPRSTTAVTARNVTPRSWISGASTQHRQVARTILPFKNILQPSNIFIFNLSDLNQLHYLHHWKNYAMIR